MAWPIIGGIVSAVSEGFQSWNNGRIKVKEAKIQAKVARYMAKAKREEMLAQAETNWDLEALRQSQYSLKDEFITLIIFAPLVVAWFKPELAKEWIEFASGTPVWYQTIMFGIVAASFGLRWWFAKKKL